MYNTVIKISVQADGTFTISHSYKETHPSVGEIIRTRTLSIADRDSVEQFLAANFPGTESTPNEEEE